MKTPATLLTALLLLPAPAQADQYNLGELARSGKFEVFNRTLDQSRADSPEAVYLSAAAGNGLAWISGLQFSQGTIELEIKGRNRPQQSFVGLAFHGQDDRTFDAVYLRPFNFQAPDETRRSHSIQYISMPDHDWANLRNNHPGKYESALSPPPEPEAWVTLKLVVAGGRVSAYVNGADQPALSVELLSHRGTGRIGLWVGNGSDGAFRSLKVMPAAE